jgi:hypothetical protein
MLDSEAVAVGKTGAGELLVTRLAGPGTGTAGREPSLTSGLIAVAILLGKQTSRQGLQGKKMWGSCAEENCFYLSPNDTIATNTMDDRAEEYRRTQNRDN